jgi:GTP-dependent phosphoenolpyruvate carboxykinase
MRFTWDKNKNRQNPRKHDVCFETAILVFDDPYAVTQRDVTFEDEERWITVGAIRPGDELGGARCETFRAERRSALSQVLANHMLLVIGAVSPQGKVTTALSNGNLRR